MIAHRHLHMAAMLRIIWYRIRTPTRGLFFSSDNPISLKAYSDADWVGCPDIRRSTGWCIVLGDSLIFWNAKNMKKFQNHLLRLSTNPCLLHAPKFFGSEVCSPTLGFQQKVLPPLCR
eukprot:TRINITY_DN11188_c1_g3_i1.p1 TRINITY_DN11188_c1_g3~~TRINITY_DN11188_c1_g3_i1.p1  ORF type:complete len:118 (+),score=6.23 TRINITY_DN11188_c1_g3_i1:294-647(+)